MKHQNGNEDDETDINEPAEQVLGTEQGAGNGVFVVSHPALSGVGSVGLPARSSLKTHHLTPTPQGLEVTLSEIP
jgi:hypothetical protein